jgi:hypothetical protein
MNAVVGPSGTEMTAGRQRAAELVAFRSKARPPPKEPPTFGSSAIRASHGGDALSLH